MAVKKAGKDKSAKEIPTNPKKMSSFFAWDGDTLILNVLGTPGAKQDAIGKGKATNSKSVSRKHRVRVRLQITWCVF